MAIEIKEEWYPMPPQLGPPLPLSMQVYWPWVKRPPEEEVPEIPLPPPPGVSPPAKYRLYVYTVGKGTVTPTDGEYPAGTTVTLTAKPGYGAAFDRWAGDAAGTSPIVSIAMDRSKSATAYFKAITPPPYDEEPPPEEIPPVPPPTAPPKADIRNLDFVATEGTYDIGGRVPFTATYEYKGRAQGGQLVVSIGTGVYPAFSPVVNYSPMAVSFAEAMDWTPMSFTGTLLLTEALKAGQLYNTQAKLQTLEDPTQIIDTDWGGIRIAELVTPLYKASISFRREWECEEGHMVGGVWICTKYFPDSRVATVTITNKGRPGSFTTTVDCWFYLSGEPSSRFANPSWTSTFEEEQSRIYTFKYYPPITGMPLDTRFFIKVKDPDGKIIAEVDYILPL